MSQLECPRCGNRLPAVSGSGPVPPCDRCGQTIALPKTSAKSDDEDWLSLEDTVPTTPRSPANAGSAAGLDLADDPFGEISANRLDQPMAIELDEVDAGAESANGQSSMGAAADRSTGLPSTTTDRSPPSETPLEIDGFEIIDIDDGDVAASDSANPADADPFDEEDPFANLQLPSTPPRPRPPTTTLEGLGDLGGELATMGRGDDLLRPDDDVEYRVKCKVCDSILFAKPNQAGSVIQCSDCHSKLKVPPPPPTVQPKRRSGSSGGVGKPNRAADPHSIGEAPNLGPAISGGAGSGGVTFRGPAAPRAADPYQRSAAELLDEASRAEADDPEEDYEVPDVKAWLLGVLSIFTDIGVIAHLCILAVAGSMVAVVAMMMNHPILILLLMPVGFVFGLVVLSCALAILESTANDNRSVEDWPSVDPGLWFENAWVTGIATLVSGLPVYLMFWYLFGARMVTVAATMASIYVFFPFVLLSILDSGSVFQPFSAEVARSVNRCQEPWGGLYFTAAIVFGLVFFAFVVAGWLGSIVGSLVAITAAVAGTFTYFAMIGRLAYAIGQDVRNQNAKEVATEA